LAVAISKFFLGTQQPSPAPPAQPASSVVDPVAKQVDPAASVSWSSVNAEGQGKDWDADRKRREAQIAADLAAKQAAVAGITLNQKARLIQQSNEADRVFNEQQQFIRNNTRKTVH
jgi:hypothetical protein